MCHILFFHRSVDRHLGYSPFCKAITNNATMNTYVHVHFSWLYIYFTRRISGVKWKICLAF